MALDVNPVLRSGSSLRAEKKQTHLKGRQDEISQEAAPPMSTVVSPFGGSEASGKTCSEA